MNAEKFNSLIIHLMAIEGYAKNIHYNCTGDNFYGNHLFADRIAESVKDFIDQIKENCLLAHSIKVAESKQYFAGASELTPIGNDFNVLKTLIIDTLVLLESINEVSRGDSKLLDDIADALQNNLGLINIMLGDIK